MTDHGKQASMAISPSPPPDRPSSNGAGPDRPRPILFFFLLVCCFTGILWIHFGLAHGIRAT